MRTPRLTAAVLAVTATFAFAAPRNEDRVLYPKDGGLSRPIVTGEKRPVATQTDAEQDEIDSYLASAHNEKHIFGNSLPKPNNGQNNEKQSVYLSHPQSQSNTQQDDRSSNAHDTNGQNSNGPLHTSNSLNSNNQQPYTSKNPSSSISEPYTGQNSESSGQYSSNGVSSSNTLPYNEKKSESSAPYTSNGQNSNNANSGNSGPYTNNSPGFSNTVPYNGQNPSNSGPLYTSNGQSPSNTNAVNSGPYTNNPSSSNTVPYNGQNLGNSGPYTSNGQSSSNKNSVNSGLYTNNPSSSNTVPYNGQNLGNSGPYTSNGQSSSNTNSVNSGPYTNNPSSSNTVPYNGQNLGNSGPYTSNGQSLSNSGNSGSNTNNDQSSTNSASYNNKRPNDSNFTPIKQNSNNPQTESDYNLNLSDLHQDNYAPNLLNTLPAHLVPQNTDNTNPNSNIASLNNGAQPSSQNTGFNLGNTSPQANLQQKVNYVPNSRPQMDYSSNKENGGLQADYIPKQPSSTNSQNYPNQSPQKINSNKLENNENQQNLYPEANIPARETKPSKQPYSPAPQEDSTYNQQNQNNLQQNQNYQPQTINQNQQHASDQHLPNSGVKPITDQYDDHKQNGYSEQNGYSDSVKPTTSQEEPVRYDGSQLWKIPADERFKLKVIGSLSAHQAITTWGGNRTMVDALIAADMVANVSEVLRKSGISYEVVISNLQKNIEEENPPFDEEQLELQNRKARAFNFWRYRTTGGQWVMPIFKPPNRRAAILGAYLGYNSLDEHMEYWPKAHWGHRMSWDQYHRIDDINGYLDYLARTYPRSCSIQIIGQSYEGRDIKLLKISNGRKNNKAVFIDGGIHAREWIAPATVTYIINHIVENYDSGPELYHQIDWYFVPVLNPDGYEYAHTTNRLWRKNRSGSGACKGVDLNRNFGYKWGGKGTSNSPCSEVYRGASAFSEPESRALRDFLAHSDADFKLYVSFHSYGQFLLHPWGYDEVVPPDYKELELAAKKAAYVIAKVDGTQYTVGASSLVLYSSAGGSDDWAKANGIKYSYTMELRDTGYYGFVLPAKYILKVGQESLQGLLVLVEAATGA